MVKKLMRVYMHNLIYKKVGTSIARPLNFSINIIPELIILYMTSVDAINAVITNARPYIHRSHEYPVADRVDFYAETVGCAVFPAE